MIRPIYADLLTPAERLQTFKDSVAIMYKLGGEKQALGNPFEWAKSLATLGLEGGLAVSVATGIPLGIAAHLVTRAMKSDAQAQREQQAKIKYYKDVSNELNQDLAGPESATPATL